MTEATPPKKPPAKKAKPPALEDKPLPEFIEQHFLPKLEQAFSDQGMSDLQLTFTKEQLQLPGTTSSEPVAQVKGSWQGGKRQFNLYFLDETLKGQKAFSCTTDGKSASTLESFMIDERRVTLDLLVLYTLQRLNGQKWLTRN